jgi:hypothetical protein
MRHVPHVKAVAVVVADEARVEAEDAAGTAVGVAVDAAVVDRAAVVGVEAVTNRRNSSPHFAKRTAETTLTFLLV